MRRSVLLCGLLVLAASPGASYADDGLMRMPPQHPAPPHHADATFMTHDTDPTPTITIVSPTEGQQLEAGQPLMLQVDLQGLTLGQDSFHVHVWVDDQPYKAMYDATQPFAIEGLASGMHSIRVAPSRPWHELFKNPGAYAAVNFQVGPQEVVHSHIDFSKPTLTYSRPKKDLTHTYAASRNLLFDYYLTGCTLGEDGYYLRLTIDGMSYLFTSWAPQFIENPPPGVHTLTIELMRNGELAEANFNPFTANWTIEPPGDGTTAPMEHH